MIKLFQTFMKYYLRLGVPRDRILLTMHSSRLNFTRLGRSSVEVTKHFGIPQKHINLWNSRFDEWSKVQLKLQLLHRVGASLDSWIIETDVDELHVFAAPVNSRGTLNERIATAPPFRWATNPGDLCSWTSGFQFFTHGNGNDSRDDCSKDKFHLYSIREKVKEAEANNMNGIVGEFRDRVASDGSLVDLKAPSQKDVFQQLPMECEVIEKIAKAPHEKLMMHKMMLVAYQGHHCPMTPAAALKELQYHGFVKRSEDALLGRFSTGWNVVNATALQPRLEEVNGCFGGVHHIKWISAVKANAKRRLRERKRNKIPGFASSQRVVTSIVSNKAVPLDLANCKISPMTQMP